MGSSLQHVELEVPRFGEFARQHVAIASADIRQSLLLQQQKGGRIGAIMQQAGYLNGQQLSDILRSQARWVARMRSHDLRSQQFPLPTSVSLCLPCFNEEQVIEEVLTGACAVLPEFLDEFELVVVDDGSSDNTAAVVERFAATDDRVRLVRHPRNRGYGAAVATGLRAARGEWIFFTDGDGQFNFLDLPQLLAQARHDEVVVGYRYRRADNAIRSLNAKGWKWVIRCLVGLRIRDLDCAFKIFPRQVVDRLQLDAEGACISAEIMAQCSRGGVKIREVPVNHYPRSVGKATGANWRVILKAFRELPVVWKYRRMRPWQLDGATHDVAGANDQTQRKTVPMQDPKPLSQDALVRPAGTAAASHSSSRAMRNGSK